VKDAWDVIHAELDRLASKHLEFSNQLGELFSAVSNAVKDKSLVRRKVLSLTHPPIYPSLSLNLSINAVYSFGGQMSGIVFSCPSTQSTIWNGIACITVHCNDLWDQVAWVGLIRHVDSSLLFSALLSRCCLFCLQH
jgi:hypothetical protein